ncbi:hypothetical protein HanIR_Chr17g0878241 [Helianthus annuus]|nr:hypothetical protein HanIR_Chr17g0878241 [Helianthus annuus]
MSPATCVIPSYFGAVETTCDKSKLIPLRCGYAFTISDIAIPVPPPTSTTLPFEPRKPSL